MRNVFYRIFLPFLLIIGMGMSASATHYMGVDITYECIGPCTYRIYHKTYYDCEGGATTPLPGPPFAPSSFNIVGQSSTGGCNAPVPIGAWQFVSYTEVTPVCPGFATACTSPSSPVNGVLEAVFYRDYNFCNVNCDTFQITWSSCCRNYAITSGAGATSTAMYSGETIIDLSIGCNSSPTFFEPPVPYICAGQPFTFNQGAFDPDFDSLSYSLGPCHEAANDVVPYSILGGYSPSQPLGSSWDVQINGFTGDVSITPQPGGAVVGVICIVVTEWRNGVQIGQVVRDMQITVIPGCTSTNPETQGVQNLLISGIPANPLSFNEVRTCAGVETCFDIPVISQDPTLNYTISWNQNLVPFGATFSDPITGTPNSVTSAQPTGRFCWTPPPGLNGAFFFAVSVRDDACPIPGFNQYTIIIYVENTLASSDAIGTPIGCNEVELNALPVSTIPSPYANIFTYEWLGNGNLQFPFNTQLSDSSLTHLYPEPSNYFFDLTIADTFGCTTDLSGIVNLTTGVTANAGPDVTLCTDLNFAMGTPALPGQSYLWTPTTGLSSSTAARPVFNMSNLGTGQDTIDYVLEVTDGICTTFDYATVIVNPNLTVDIAPANPSVCPGDSITLTASGGIRFQWSTGDTTASITVAPANATSYSVVAFTNGCSSPPDFVTVDVTPGPPAQIAGDFKVCPDGATTLTATGGDTYLWSAGGFTQSTITLAGLNADSTIWVIPYSNAGCSGDTVFATLETYTAPEADFSVPAVCQGSESVFADSSSVAEGGIAAWAWDFGDPASGAQNSSSQASPSHIFSQPGTYLVRLTVTSDNGCQDEMIRPVVVDPVPDADFTFSNVCQGLPNVFIDASTIAPGGTIATYVWDFGDGSAPASGTNVSHVYNTYGYYNVTLTTTSDNGCTDNFTKTVFVNPNPEADFQVLSACQDSVVFASTASTVAGSLDHISTHLWNFGDPGSGAANTSTSPNPVHVYANAGVYTLTLTVTTQNGCTDLVQREVTVYPSPSADFTYDLTCANEQTRFIDLSAGGTNNPVVQRIWNLGVGGPISSTGPVRQYGTPGTYQVMLAILTQQGCVDTVYKDVVINPVPAPLYQASRVCEGDTTDFTDLSTIVTGSITDWQWDFGDGRGASTLASPSYPYVNAGTYTSTLTLTSDSGCVSVRPQAVIVDAIPAVPDILGDTVCFSNPAFLLASAPSDVTVNWYRALDSETRFYQGYSYVTPALPYDETYYVESVSQRGCISERVPVTGAVFSDESFAIVSSHQVIDMPLAIVNFSAVSTLPISDYSWNFGDGSTSKEVSPAHEYLFPGIYEVTLSGADANGCDLSASIIVEVKKVTGVHVPSAFSPNGDGINDEFQVGFYNVSQFNFQVFNRWGQKVFESDNPDFRWDGKDENGVSVIEGVYVYVLKALDFDGDKIEESRTITLIR